MKKIGIGMILFFLLVPAATAASVTISPTTIDSGDTVSVDVKGIPNDAVFSLSIGAEFDVNPGEKFAFTARDLFLPFSLGSGEVSAYTRGTNWTGLSAKKGDTSLSMSNSADENGEFRTTQAFNISSGTYEVITLDGKATPTAKSIIAEMTMSGKKKGPNDGTISFALEGVEHGAATIAVYIDGSEALSQTITIGSSSSGGSGGSGGSSGSSGSGGSSGSSGSSGPAPTTTSSIDGKVSLTGTDIEGSALLSLAVDGILPDGWSTAGRAYAVTPADRTFSPAAVLSFHLPTTATTATIARLEDGAWSAVPSKIEGDRITTTVTRGGSYVLLVPAASAAEPDQTDTTTVTTTPTTSTTTPVTTTPAVTPLSPLLPVLACAILMLARVRKG